MQLLLISKFYCFCPGPHISFKHAQHNHLCCPMIGEVSLETYLIKYTCSWRVNLLHYEHWTDKQKYFYELRRACRLFWNHFKCYCIVRHVKHIGIVMAFYLPGGICYVFQCLKGQEKVLGCGFLEGINTQVDTSLWTR